ncbi:cellulose biosynthesis protein BcsF [Enterobacteriaceae bacterium Kacie_13]|nr:cellulose biosynthesis protein BcsF [Enterobacteriaceae bacterium Kacie_13]
MNISDIIEIFILAAFLFIPLGYALRSRVPRWKNQLAARFFKPRYLTPITISMVNKHRQRDAQAKASPATGKTKTSL